MTEHATARRALIAVLASALLVAWLHAPVADIPRLHAANNADADPPTYLGADGCAQCHEQPGRRNTDHVQLVESAIWKDFDHHSQSHVALTAERTAAMERAMGWAEKSARKDDRCLSCHNLRAVDLPTAGDFRVNEGVSCELCHGPSSKWDTPHRDRKNWLAKTAEQKKAMKFIDVRDPVQRADLCLSCHIGDSKQDRVVTHEMYAAGHPPLGAIEVAHASEMMPRHWRQLAEKTKLPAEDAKAMGYVPGRLDRARHLAVAAVAAVEYSARLIADAVAKPDLWPELAMFDCAACHHELRPLGWRLLSGAPATGLGNPAPQRWPVALARLVLEDEAAPNAVREFDDHMAALNAAAARAPFGEPRSLSQSAKELANWCRDQLPAIGRRPWLERDAKALLAKLVERAGGPTAEPLDFDSSRQLAAAIITLATELGFAEPDRLNDAQRNEWALLLKMADLRFPPPVRASLLDGLPARSDLLKELPRTLDAAAAFDPRAFREAINNARPLLIRQD